MCVMDFVSHRGITLILIGMHATQFFCLVDVNLSEPFFSMTKILCYLELSCKTRVLAEV